MHTHTHTHACTRTCARTHTHTHTHTLTEVWLVVPPESIEEGNTISNYVTDLANHGQSTSKSYLNLGTKLSNSPEIYYTTLKVQ